MAEELAPEKIVINGVEYDPSDAQTLIDLGSKTRDFEKQWNTSLDKVYPDYTRASQEAAQAKKELDEIRAKASQTELPEDQAKAKEALRKLGVADQDYLRQQGYMTRSELEEFYSKKRAEEQSISQVLGNADRLEKEIDGSDGRVPFNKKAVLAYASAYGINDLSKAYDEMYERLNAGWKQQQIDAVKKPGLTTLKSKGSHVPTEKKITTEQEAREAMRELFSQGE